MIKEIKVIKELQVHLATKEKKVQLVLLEKKVQLELKVQLVYQEKKDQPANLALMVLLEMLVLSVY